MGHVVFLGLGSNLGNREETILKAYREIERLIGAIRRQSAFYYSEPWGFDSPNSFVNTVVMVDTRLSPRQVLRRTQQIERLLGKTKAHATDRLKKTLTSKNLSLLTSHFSPLTSKNPSPLTSHFSLLTSPFSLYKDRPIDIDILLYDDLTVNDPDLTIPHPLMNERPFVMEPLREVTSQVDE